MAKSQVAKQVSQQTVENIVVGNPPKKGLLGRKLAVLVVVVGLVLVGAVTVLVLRTENTKKNDYNQTVRRATDAYSAASSDKTGKLYDDAIAQFDKAINSTDVQSDKLIFYYQKATLALNTKRYDDALEFSLEAERVMPTRSSAALVAASYEAKSDKTKAIQYYQKAIDRLNMKSENDQADAVQYRQIIRELEK